MSPNTSTLEKVDEVVVFDTKTASSSRDTSKDDIRTPAREWTDLEEKQLLRKLDWMLLPGLWMMLLISMLDRSNIGNARIAGMAADLQLSSSSYSMVIVAFYISYIPLSPICSMAVARARPSILLPLSVVAWGFVTCMHALAKTYAQLVVLRLLLGALETALTPACIMLLSSWYRPAEQSIRALVFTSSVTLGGAFGGLLAGSITGGLEGARGIRGWQWLFVVEGVITIVWGISCFFLIPDFPENSKLISPRLCEVALLRLKGTGTASYAGKRPGGQKLGKINSIVVACKDWRTWLVTLATMCLGGSFVLPYFYPTLVNGMGYKNPVTAQYMTVPIWAAALVWSIGISIVADREGMATRRALLMSLSVGGSMVFSIVICAVHGYTERYALLVIMGLGVWSTLPLGLSFAATTFRDMEPEARAVAVGFTSIGVQSGNIYGAYLFAAETAPKYLIGFGTIAGTQAASAILFMITYIFLRRREAQIDRLAHPTIASGKC